MFVVTWRERLKLSHIYHLVLENGKINTWNHRPSHDMDTLHLHFQSIDIHYPYPKLHLDYQSQLTGLMQLYWVRKMCFFECWILLIVLFLFIFCLVAYTSV